MWMELHCNLANLSDEAWAMEPIDDRFLKQIERAVERYEKQSSDRESRSTNLKLGGDWRKAESSLRVLRRMISLGLNDLAGKMLASEAVQEGVESAIQPGEKVSLLERIIEEDDLLSARFLHMGSTISRAVARVLIRSQGRTIGYGTCFLVSPRLMMTNNHVLDREAVAGESLIEFDFYERQSGQTGPTVLFKLEPQTFFLTNEDLDFTLVAVAPYSTTGVPLQERGWIPLIRESGKALVGEPVNIIQHPQGEPQQIAIKNNEIVDQMTDFLHYKTDTDLGSSGSPVLNMQWELAALHHSGVVMRDAQKRILLRDGTVWDGNPTAADRIAWIANEGVRVSSIVAAVEQTLEDTPGSRGDLFQEALAGAAAPATPRPASKVQPVPLSLPMERTLEPDDKVLDSLTPQEVATILSRLEDQSMEITREAATPGEVLVAEGDSWFDYSLAGLDIIDCLKMFHGYRIHNVAMAGDTLDNMAWGTDYDQNWRRKRAPLLETLDAVREYHPRVVLLSGGGNDIAGDELLSFLNHKESGLQALRQPYTDFVIKEYFRRAFEKIMESIWGIDASIHFITHGYGYGVPDGRGVINFIGFSFIGPWLRPALTAKGYDQKHEREGIIRQLVDKVNEMHQAMAAADAQGRIHYINLRPLIASDDWENELHLRNSAYKRIAAEFDRVIRAI